MVEVARSPMLDLLEQEKSRFPKPTTTKNWCLFCIWGYSKHIIFSWKSSHFFGVNSWDWDTPPRPPLSWQNPKKIPTSAIFSLKSFPKKMNIGLTCGHSGFAIPVCNLFIFTHNALHCHICWSENMKHFWWPRAGLKGSRQNKVGHHVTFFNLVGLGQVPPPPHLNIVPSLSQVRPPFLHKEGLYCIDGY